MGKQQMRVLPMEQNSDEWLEFRRGRSGGSGFGSVWVSGQPLKGAMLQKLEEKGELTPETKKLTAAKLAALLTPKELAEVKLEGEPKTRYYEMVAERVARPITPNDYVERLKGEPFSMMARGHLLEPDALQAFSKRFNKHIHPQSCVWVKNGNDGIYISPDGVVCSAEQVDKPIDSFIPTEAAEVKCLNSTNIVKAYLTGHYPDEYYAQVLKYFIVNHVLKTLYFILYTDAIPGLELQVFEIHREDLTPALEEAEAFEEVMMERVVNDAEKIERLGF